MSVYDLYQSYLNQLQNPVVQQSPLFDYRLLYPQVQQDGGDSMGGGITQLSPQQMRDAAMQQEFEAAALRDEQGNVIGGLTEKEQELMDQARGKGRLSGYDKFNIGSMFLGGGLPNMFSLMASRRLGQNQALKQLSAMQNADTSDIGINAVTRPGTYGYDDVIVGGSGTGGDSGGWSGGSGGFGSGFSTSSSGTEETF
jgi:hypothetical protein